MAKQYFEFKDKTSSKFWEIYVKGKEVTVRYGRIGTDGQAATKEFSSPAAAAAHAEKVVAEKVKKGYTKPSGAGTSAKSSPSLKASKSKGSSKKPGATPKAPSQNPKSPPSKVGIIVSHRIAQRLEIDLSEVAADDADSAIELHNAPDIYVYDESFPGEMSWKVVESSAVESGGKRETLWLSRTIDFTFSSKRSRALSNWIEQHVSLEDALLPSYVAGDFEGISVGEESMDYDTQYLGECYDVP